MHALLAAGALAPATAHGQVTTITPATGPTTGLGTTTSLVGNETRIDGGTAVGANLFHSFSQFDLAQGDAARWVRAGGGAAFANVINVIGGGDVSEIFGVLDAGDFPNANFYFMNPSGFVFGDGFAVNIPGAVYFSTAHQLRFPGGAILSATAPAGPSLSMASPESFGFLSGQSGDIAFLNGGSVSQFGALNVSARNVTLDNYTLQFTDSAGGVSLSAVGSEAHALLLNGPLPNNLTGTMSLFSSVIESNLIAPGMEGAGAIDIAARRVEASNTIGAVFPRLRILNQSTHAAGDLTILGADIALTSTELLTTSTGSGAGADIVLQATQSINRTRGVIRTQTYGTGDGGDMTFTAPFIGIYEKRDPGVFAQFGVADIDASSFASGVGGSITFNADILEVFGVDLSAQIGIQSNARSTGNAGGITLNVTDLVHGRYMAFTSRTSGEGQAGPVTVNTPAGLVFLDLESGLFAHAGEIPTPVVPGAQPTGDGGLISVFADTLILRDARIVTGSLGQLGASAGDIDISARRIELQTYSAINSSSEAGQAGAITLNMPRNGLLWIQTGIIFSTNLSPTNPGGVVTISRPAVVVMQGGAFPPGLTLGDIWPITIAGIEALGEVDGANISISADYFIQSMEQPSHVAVDGSLVLDTLASDPVASAAALDAGFLSAGDVLASQCATQRAGGASLLNYGDDSAPALMQPSPLMAPQFYATAAFGSDQTVALAEGGAPRACAAMRVP